MCNYSSMENLKNTLYLYRDPLRDGGKIRTPSVNWNPEYQLASRVATSQLKEPRVRPVDKRGSDFPLSRLRGPGIDITTIAKLGDICKFRISRQKSPN